MNRQPLASRASDRRTGFHYTSAMRALCRDICTRVPAMQHIQLQRVAVGFAQARNRSAYGTYATLTPLRFRNGERFERRSNATYMIQRVLDSQGLELLYILTFYLPRFQDIDFSQKLVTIFHELWHISPQFNGDIRRFAGRCYAHSKSQKAFDAHAARLAEQWLGMNPPRPLYEFLTLSFDELVARHGTVYGSRFEQPKIVRVPEPGMAAH